MDALQRGGIALGRSDSGQGGDWCGEYPGPRPIKAAAIGAVCYSRPVEVWRGGLDGTYRLPILSFAGASVINFILFIFQLRWNHFDTHLTLSAEVLHDQRLSRPPELQMDFSAPKPGGAWLTL